MIKMKRKKRGVGNPNWKKDATEVELIKKIHNQWCKDNGYPLIKRKYVYKGKWKIVDVER